MWNMAVSNISYPIYPLSTRTEKGYITKVIPFFFVQYTSINCTRQNFEICLFTFRWLDLYTCTLQTTNKAVNCACFYKYDDTLLITYGAEHLYFWRLFWDPVLETMGKIFRDKLSGKFDVSCNLGEKALVHV